jgi:cob(I)alamin adenosyltransferase
MKIYTKTGDTGKTSLLTGNRVPKYHLRIQAFGSVDELNSFIGLLRSNLINESDLQILALVQNQLFNIGSSLAMDEKRSLNSLPEIVIEDIERLEKEMDLMDSFLPRLKDFIIPGGNQAISLAHVCRSICRRAERLCVELSDNDYVDNIIIIYLNRLSDYFFMLSRKIAFESKIEMPIWKK